MKKRNVSLLQNEEPCNIFILKDSNQCKISEYIIRYFTKYSIHFSNVKHIIIIIKNICITCWSNSAHKNSENSTNLSKKFDCT